MSFLKYPASLFSKLSRALLGCDDIELLGEALVGLCVREEELVLGSGDDLIGSPVVGIGMSIKMLMDPHGGGKHVVLYLLEGALLPFELVLSVFEGLAVFFVAMGYGYYLSVFIRAHRVGSVSYFSRIEVIPKDI